jgi:transcriptional regulator with XRE-family HTH domain
MSGPVVIDPGKREPRPRPLLRATLGGILRRTRLAQRRTLADVARAARVSMPYLSELERGRKEASSEVLAAICDALRIEMSDLLATAGRDLVGSRGRRGQVVRLAAVRGDRVWPETTAPPVADVAPESVASPETVVAPETVASPEASVVCLLAA